jgi:hypothetical protein
LLITELLNQFEPESEGLLRGISAHISDQMLRRIAEADYGQDVDKHLEGLRQIRDEGTFPPNMSWFPAEVLELFRYPDPGSRDPKLGEDDQFVHWALAFCCVALLRATQMPWNYGDGISTDRSTIRLILSLGALAVDFTPEAVKFFAWLLTNSNPEGVDNQVCVYGSSLLWFALNRTPCVEDETLIYLAKWVVRRAKEFYPELIFDSGALPLRMGFGNPPPSPWVELGAALFDLDLRARATELKELIQQIGLELVG